MIGGLSLHAAQTTMYRRNVDKRTEEYTYYEAKQCSALPDGAVSYSPPPPPASRHCRCCQERNRGRTLVCSTLYKPIHYTLAASSSFLHSLLYFTLLSVRIPYSILYTPILSCSLPADPQCSLPPRRPAPSTQ